MALASLILSFFSFFVPLGIAAVVLGHVSRSQIAKSEGRQKGMGVAFAGLIIGYLQLALAGLFFLGLASLWDQFHHELDDNPYTRAALAERLKNGDPYKVTPAVAARHQENTIAALRLIRSKQGDYLTAHPDIGYACQLYELGSTAEDSELALRIRDSLYEIQIAQCSRVGELRYVVVAVPNSTFNLPGSPVYCLDQTEVIRKYSDEQAREALPNVTGRPQELCPQIGETIE